MKIKRNVPSFDINAVCAGFVYAMSFASTMITGGIYKKILIVASETYSKHMTNNDEIVFFLVMEQGSSSWNSH